jgi:hypothetical protein
MRRARQLGRIFGEDIVKKLGESATPVLCLMLRGVRGQVIDERASVVRRFEAHHFSMDYILG